MGGVHSIDIRIYLINKFYKNIRKINKLTFKLIQKYFSIKIDLQQFHNQNNEFIIYLLKRLSINTFNDTQSQYTILTQVITTSNCKLNGNERTGI